MSPYVDTSDIDEAFAKAPETTFDSAPDGTYIAMITKAGLRFVGQQNPERVFEWRFEIEGGGYEGVKINKIAFLRGEQQYGMLKTDLRKCGLDGFRTLADVQQHCGSLVGGHVELELRTREWNGKTYQNAIIKKALDARKPETHQQEPPPPEDETPF